MNPRNPVISIKSCWRSGPFLLEFPNRLFCEMMYYSGAISAGSPVKKMTNVTLSNDVAHIRQGPSLSSFGL